MSTGRLHVLTDFHFQQRFGHAELAERAIDGGADVIQFRQKSGTLRSKLYELERTAEVCARYGVPLLVDDHVDLAVVVGAAGVHLGDDDLPAGMARRILGPEAVVGVTASGMPAARQAEADGASYIGFGPVFATASKANPKPVRGLAALAAVCHAVRIPVIAIGGMVPGRVAEVLEAGAHGVAVLTAVSAARDIVAATRAFRTAIDSARG